MALPGAWIHVPDVRGGLELVGRRGAGGRFSKVRHVGGNFKQRGFFMKGFGAALAVVLFLISGLVQASQAPFLPEVEQRFQNLEAGSSFTAGAIPTAALAAGAVTEAKLEVPTSSGLYVPRVARIVWDPSSDNSVGTVASHASGITIPANAVIRQVWFFTKTSLVSTSNDGTLAVKCNNNNDIFSAADIDSSSGVAGQVGAGVEVGTAATMLKVVAACNINFVVAVHPFTAGKMEWFIEYVIAE